MIMMLMINTANFHTKNCQTKSLRVRIPKSLRQEISRCAKKAHLLYARLRLTQTPNLEILSLKIVRITDVDISVIIDTYYINDYCYDI